VDVESIEWLECDVTTTPKINSLTYEKDNNAVPVGKDRIQKIFCDMSRICELEDAVEEWYDNRYFQRQKEVLNLDFFT
jgi:hypothetical protein